MLVVKNERFLASSEKQIFYISNCSVLIPLFQRRSDVFLFPNVLHAHQSVRVLTTGVLVEDMPVIIAVASCCG